MAEKQEDGLRDGREGVYVHDTLNKVNLVDQTSKRCSPSSPCSAPPNKSPRTDSLPPTTQRPNPDEDQSEMNKKEMQIEDTEKTISPTAQKKSWRRATITRRSLPALPNPYLALCRTISTSLSQQERLEKLLEASMKLALERTQKLLQSVPGTSLELFQKQVENIQAEWVYLAKNISDESHKPLSSLDSSSEPAVQKAMKNVQRAINRLKAESESWEALLNKHQQKAEELVRKVERGQKMGISLNSTSMAQSSQYPLIQSKPDYHDLLCRQRPMMHTVAMIMDTQCKITRQLLSIKDQSQLFVKETSGRLAEEAGFQDLSSDPLRSLMSAPVPAATT